MAFLAWVATDRVFTAVGREETTDCLGRRDFLTCSRIMRTRVLLADDHGLIRQGLKALLEGQGFQVVGEASDGQEMLRTAEKTRPDVAILDIRMPVLNGVDAARGLKKSSPSTKIIILTQHDENQYVPDALHPLAKAYLL